MKRIKLLMILVMLGLLFACDNSQPASTATRPKTKVDAIEIIKQDIPLMGKYIGKSAGYRSVEVRAQIAGILTNKYFTEGSYVTKGEALFEIDPKIAEANLEQAKANLLSAQSSLSNASREYTRVQNLAKQNAVSNRDLDNARNSYENARANVESAKAVLQEGNINLQYTQVLAPISGYTSLDVRDIGNLISLDANGSLLTTINQTDPILIEFSIPANEMLFVRRLVEQNLATQKLEGESVTITMLDGQKYDKTGSVSFVDTRIDPSVNVLKVRAEFPNPDAKIMPGEFGSIEVGGAMLINAMLIPQKAILQTANGPMVYKVDDKNIAQLIPVSLGSAINQDFMVVDGLEVKDIIIIEGINKIAPGEEVLVNLVQKNAEEANNGAK